METTNRQARRARSRALSQRGSALLRDGLQRSADFEDRVACSLALSDVLVQAKRNGRIDAFLDAVYGLYRASERRSPSKLQLACKKGCNWCCHNAVGATAPEIYMASKIGDVARIFAASPLAEQQSVEASALSPEQRLGRKLPCALLTPGGCAAYGSRPIMCRVATSLDVNPCIDEYEGVNLAEAVPVSRIPIEIGTEVRVVTVSALRLQSLDSAIYDLAGGLLECRNPSSVARRILDGGAAFESAKPIPLDRDLDVEIERIVQGCLA